MTPTVRIQEEDFDVGTELAALRAGRPDIGALVNFVGLVRDGKDPLSSLELEHYPGMTEKALRAIAGEAARRWSLLATTIIHRVGLLPLGGQIVLVAVASAHRLDAFAAAEFIMDALKTRAPFWKKEQTASGSRWVEARESDEVAAARWTRN